MAKKALLILLILVCGSLCLWAGTHSPWDGTKWDVTSPDIDQPYGNSYKELYDLRKGVALRINKEHETLATSSAGGVHKQGSARAFFQDAAPTTQIDGTAWDSGDRGSFWFDTNASPDNLFYVLTDHASTGTWTLVSTSLIAEMVAASHSWAGTQTFNDGIVLGAGDDLIGSSTSDITFNTDKFTVAGATGNTVVGGTLSVTGTSTLTGVVTLGDSSQMATSTAPTADADLANKKYVDDNEAATKYSINPMTGADDSNGTITFPNGLIWKWGKLTRTATNTTLTFAVAFPDACFQVFACGGKDTQAGNDTQAHTITASSAIIRMGTDATPARWFAVGR